MFDLGDIVTLPLQVTDDGGTPIDAGGITLTVTKPDGTTDSFAAGAITHDSLGNYHVDYTPAAAGRHAVRWVTTGAGQGAYADVFDVAPANPAWALSLADAREALRKAVGDTASDEELRLYLGAVTVIVDAAVGPQSLTTKTVTRDGGKAAVLLPSQIIAVTEVLENDQELDPATDYFVDVEAGIVYRGSKTAQFRFLPGACVVQVTYTAGRSVVADNVRIAARIILRHLWQADNQQSNRPRLGAQGVPEGTTTVAGYAIPYRAAELLTATPGLIPGFA